MNSVLAQFLPSLIIEMENLAVKILIGLFISMLIMPCVLSARLPVVNKRGEWKFGDEISSVYALILKGLENTFSAYWNTDPTAKKSTIEEPIFSIHDISVFFDTFFIPFCLSFETISASSHI